MKRTLLKTIDERTIPALELAIAGEDAVRVNNIIKHYHIILYKMTGVYYEDEDWYELYGDNLNGYVSHLIRELNEIFK